MTTNFNILFEQTINKQRIIKQITNFILSTNESDNDETVPMYIKAEATRQRLEDTLKNETLTKDQQVQVKTALDAVKNIQTRNNLKRQINIDQDELDKYYSDLDALLLSTFGKWWKLHVHKRESEKQLVKDFQRETDIKNSHKTAMPLHTHELSTY